MLMPFPDTTVYNTTDLSRQGCSLLTQAELAYLGLSKHTGPLYFRTEYYPHPFIHESMLIIKVWTKSTFGVLHGYAGEVTRVFVRTPEIPSYRSEPPAS